MGNKFEQLIRDLFAGNGGATSYPMYEIYVTYALNTNLRGEIFADFISNYIHLQNKSYLDVGAAYGGCLVAMNRKGCKLCTGVEIDERLVAIARENLTANGISPDNVFCCDITNSTDLQKLQIKYDFISCIDVVEHVLNIEKTLSNIDKLTAKNGAVYLEIPNKYCPLNVVSDPHFGHYGITLLDRDEAMKYFECYDASTYTVGDYYDLKYIVDILSHSFNAYNLSMLDYIDIDSVNTAFKDNIKTCYYDKIENLRLSETQKKVLLGSFSKYINQFELQMSNPDVMKYYIQSWKLLLSKKTLFNLAFKLYCTRVRSKVCRLFA